MKTSILLIIIMCLAFVSNAQTINNNVIASGGTILKKDNVQLEYTLGETMTNTFTKQGSQITQGFHQPNIVVSRMSENEIENETETVLGNKEVLSQNGELSLSIFPNPVTDFVNISSETDDEIQITLFDASGKLVQQLKHQSSTQIDFTNYVAGTYFLVATTEDGKTRNTFKVIKQR